MIKIIILDTETTGLPKKRGQSALDGPNCWPDIVSISWSIFIDGVKLTQKTFLIKPDGWAIPPESSAIHGITEQQAAENGHPLANILNEFQEDLHDVKHVIAHNMEFDKNVIFNAYKWRLGKNPHDIWPKRGDICTMKNSEMELQLPSKRRTPTGYKMPSLAELWTDTFHTDALPNAHSANRDVEVLEKICLARWKHIFT